MKKRDEEQNLSKELISYQNGLRSKQTDNIFAESAKKLRRKRNVEDQMQMSPQMDNDQVDIKTNNNLASNKYIG